jgi:hypothetical protein
MMPQSDALFAGAQFQTCLTNKSAVLSIFILNHMKQNQGDGNPHASFACPVEERPVAKVS